jgi:hypothetical protein
LFYEDQKKGNYKETVKDFLLNHENYIYNSSFSVTEKNLTNIILPADILLRYLYDDKDIMMITSTLVSEIYDKKKIDEFALDFLNSDARLEEFINYITDYSHFKKHFFS